MVKAGEVMPIWYDPNYNGESFSVPKVMEGSPILPFPDFYRKVKGGLPSGHRCGTPTAPTSPPTSRCCARS